MKKSSLYNSLDLLVAYSNLTDQQRLEAFKLYISNRQKNDKYSLCYFLDMVESRGHTIDPDFHKRQVLLDKLIEEVSADTKNLYRCIQSDYTRVMIASYHVDSNSQTSK